MIPLLLLSDLLFVILFKTVLVIVTYFIFKGSNQFDVVNFSFKLLNVLTENLVTMTVSNEVGSDI